MKITCERGYLANALGIARSAVSSRNTLPILSNVLLETEDDKLKLTATDLDTAIRSVIPAQVSENGAVAIPAALLNDLVSKLGDAPISLELQDGKVKVRSGKSDYTVLSLPAEDFPVVPEVTDGTDITLPQATLKEMLRLTVFAASKEETRSILMGVLFEARGNSLTLVATDTHRLAWKKTQLSEEVSTPVSAIIPAKPLSQLMNSLSESIEDTVHIRFGASQVQFETSDVTLVSRVLDGQFPNYEKVIPKSRERRVTVERAEFLGAMRRVVIVAKQNNEKAIFTTKNDIMEITAQSSDIGDANEEVGIAMDGENLQIAFNSRYLVEVLTLLHDDKITLDLAGALNPGILRSQNGGEEPIDDFLYVVMPMQA